MTLFFLNDKLQQEKRYLYNSFKSDEKYKLKYVDKLVDVTFLISGIKHWNLKICHRASGWLSNISDENIILWTNVTNDKHLHKAITIL